MTFTVSVLNYDVRVFYVLLSIAFTRNSSSFFASKSTGRQNIRVIKFVHLFGFRSAVHICVSSYTGPCVNTYLVTHTCTDIRLQRRSHHIRARNEQPLHDLKIPCEIVCNQCSRCLSLVSGPNVLRLRHSAICLCYKPNIRA